MRDDISLHKFMQSPPRLNSLTYEYGLYSIMHTVLQSFSVI